MIVKQHSIAKPYAKDKTINTRGNWSGEGNWTVPVRAEYCKSSCVDTCPIQLPKTLEGHSLMVWVPVWVARSTFLQPLILKWLSWRQTNVWVFTASTWSYTWVIFYLCPPVARNSCGSTIHQPNGLNWKALKSPGMCLALRKELLTGLLKLGICVFP